VGGGPEALHALLSSLDVLPRVLHLLMQLPLHLRRPLHLHHHHHLLLLHLLLPHLLNVMRLVHMILLLLLILLLRRSTRPETRRGLLHVLLILLLRQSTRPKTRRLLSIKHLIKTQLRPLCSLLSLCDMSASCKKAS
jgi:hypothetical protein